MESPESAPLLQVENLHKAYETAAGSMPVLRGVSLAVESGDLVSIIGPSGCGKSTFLRCLNFLEVPSAGRIAIAGVEIDCKGLDDAPPKDLDRKSHELRKHVGMVFQQFNLFPHKTVLENVMLAPRIVRKRERGESRMAAMDLLGKVGLAEFADRYPSQMSGGQQQRAAIARALAMRPAIMLYDEPTSALDPEMVGEVLQVMKDLDREGMTQIVVTHEMAFARDASDYIVFMEGGVVVEISDEDEIFENPKDERTRRFLSRFQPR